ncbi:hypothetical protein VC83_01902 [Pseudogymnoascus destructans]|uniref:Uncharacterized protein n=2 Tax=Pseudogymnoascus destructans TaxID=655981 RepID=L8G8N2_PSED2|nr:uncharacterized protein VC83_01902 [Pseudogymnoascus destructans]ELR09447.1 hypothetical protein GMDG_04007 [Pseudogymnoascus destructans 20631-21]OAF61242.1 hypothetical protein VC83_01902 [Pseudogymnoascus destructans]
MVSIPIRRFTNLRHDRPDISDSMLLNSNNQTEFTGVADVVVAGAGIIGLCYAIHLKNISPHLEIDVFEKSSSPTQKIGESTLSSFSRFVSGDIIPHDYFLRLFGLKDGLQFYCVDERGLSVTSEDIGGLDLSFQLDRRMSELFLTMWAQKIGINVYHGVGTDFKVMPEDAFAISTNGAKDGAAAPNQDSGTAMNYFMAPRVSLDDASHSLGTSVKAKLVCDATGFSRRLTSKFGNRETFGGWNCDAYWAYFQETGVKAEDRLAHWNYPATKHICFPEGWGWFIKLISWEKSPLSNLMDLISYVIDNAKRNVAACDIPSTKVLSEMFDCPYEFITSIGWAVRNDHEFPDNLEEYGATESERKFTYFKRKYPTLERLMDNSYAILPNYYGRKTYFVRKSMAFQSPVVAGEGWLAIGNSAGFTNPLISPGINAGIGGAFYAAMLTHEILAAPEGSSWAIMKKSANAFQAYHHDFMMPRLNQMNRCWYNMFRDHRLFEALIPSFWAVGVQEIDYLYGASFVAEDINWVVGAGTADFQTYSKAVLDILEPSFDGVAPTEDAVEQVQALTSDAPSSVNDLLKTLRRSYISPESSHEPTVQTPTLPPSLRNLLDLPSTPTPRPRRPQRLDANGHRLPAGPAPPQSWLDSSRHAPKPETESHGVQGSRRPALHHLPGITRKPRPGSLVGYSLRRMAEDWDFQNEYNQYHLASLPTRLRTLLLSYIARYGPVDGVGYIGLERLLQLPEDDDSGQEVNNEDFTRLDLASAVASSVSLKHVMRLIHPPTNDSTPAVVSWDAPSPPQSIRASPLIGLTHVSLANPGPAASWVALLAFAAATPTLTHVSLASWPAPNLTPNATAVNAKMSARGSPVVNLAAEDRYAHSIDLDFSAAAAILRRLARRWYSLEYLDVDGCAEWWKALGWGTEKEGIDWAGDWARVRCISMRNMEGSRGVRTSSPFGKSAAAKTFVREFEAYVRKHRGWIDIIKDEDNVV